MKSKKGQALVEFVLVLPIIIMVFISMVDLGNILIKKSSLENDLDIVSKMYKKEDTEVLNKYLNDNSLKIDYKRDADFITITLSKSVEIISPVLIPIMGDTYEISTSGVYYE